MLRFALSACLLLESAFAQVGPAAPPAPLPRPAASQPIFAPRHVELKSGLRLQYVEQGSNSGTPMILLHGITDSWHSYELLLPRLPSNIRAIAITQRGHGDSSKPATGYVPATMARDVAEFLDAMNIDQAIIVGHSMGSFIAQRFAIDYPSRTRKLVLMGTFASMKQNQAVHDYWRDIIRHVKDPVDPTTARDFQMSTVVQPVPPEFMNTMIGESLKAPARVWRETFRALMMADNTPDLPKVQAPTLVLWGDKDAFFGAADQQSVLRGIKRARLITYEGVGHAPHWEQPTRVAEDLTAFLAE